VELREWSESTEIEDIESFDIGIMPLEESPWERGKCGLKLIQYMACGKPVVTSPIGANTKIVKDKINGLHANSDDAWCEALLTICDNIELAREFGSAGRSRVKKRYCLDVTSPILISIIRSLSNDC